MAPTNSTKATPEVQRTVSKTKVKASTASTIASIKKTMSTRKVVNGTQIKVNSSVVKARGGMASPCTPKKEMKPAAAPKSVTKNLKKVHKKKAGHSGVPIPSEMVKLMKQQAVAAAL